MKHVYVISIINSQNQMVSYTIVAPNMGAAIAAAREKAGVADTVDPNTFQKLATIDAEVS